MNTEDLAKLTPDQKRLAIAEACGWKQPMKDLRPNVWHHRDTGTCWGHELPDFLNSLDACAQFEAAMTDSQHARFRAWLCVTIGQKKVIHGEDDPQKTASENERKYISATAAQRADAFLLCQPSPNDKQP